MARRRTSLIDDIFDMLVQLPWWVGVIFAGIFWVVGLIFADGQSDDAIRSALRPLFRLVFNGLAILSLIAAVFSAIKSLSRRKLLDRQRGISSLRNLSWQQFEQLVGEAYRRQGYTVNETGGGGADGGVDVILRGNGETVLVQCKRWKTRTVGVDKIRELFGVLTGSSADRGILVTCGNFTKQAHSFAAGKPITLVDGPALTQLVHDVQPDPCTLADAPAPAFMPSDAACPNCGELMVLRTARRGANAGSQFYGCSRYPQCRGTRQAD